MKRRRRRGKTSGKQARKKPQFSKLIFIGTTAVTFTGFYYRKAEKENTKGGIVYDTAMAQMGQRADEQPPDTPT